ncbi:hypothetical protein SAICODRAFT_28643 [Saitoella complicata NRRL Y-17804]|uniref:uncharacterized protein n=1 Tax=Saitoella complicata (strain BCRC 22490 / CBS 7301 / JCM 7358 / NBRC 10748 / NRRL Y-17804) TaxID=698492 RepID=UPI00086745AE|nr:uncharacterized protein SAICODRAFT_28643 [Saitoella complicata NRRL Y-17804]ODQ56565.1 hypothetical protein SAICODRAFT_28643 [Saitoella complicata NRRL Y-17804]
MVKNKRKPEDTDIETAHGQLPHTSIINDTASPSSRVTALFGEIDLAKSGSEPIGMVGVKPRKRAVASVMRAVVGVVGEVPETPQTMGKRSSRTGLGQLPTEEGTINALAADIPARRFLFPHKPSSSPIKEKEMGTCTNRLLSPPPHPTKLHDDTTDSEPEPPSPTSPSHPLSADGSSGSSGSSSPPKPSTELQKYQRWKKRQDQIYAWRTRETRDARERRYERRSVHVKEGARSAGTSPEKGVGAGRRVRFSM